jgi:hypothetical protein
MDVLLAQALSHISPDIVDALWRETERHARRVVVFLAEFLKALPPTVPATTWAFPPSFLLDLCTGLCLLYWEDCGVTVHRDAGLPSATQLIHEAFAGLRLREDANRWSHAVQLFHDVMGLFVEHIAWHGHAELGGEFVLGQVNEDALVDVLARFAWEHRHDLLPDSAPE